MINISQIKLWVKENQADIVLVISVILIALISFGLGRLTAPNIIKEPITIKESIFSSQPAAISNQLTGTTTEITSQTPSNEKGIIVASKYGKKYHWPWCTWAKKIKPENQVWFKSEEEAKKAGYQPCSAFQKLAPVNYSP